MIYFLIFFLFQFIALADQFDNFKLEMESKVRELAQQMKTSYDRRCDTNVVSCQTKSYNECEGTSSKKCFDNFPKPPFCLSDGAYLSQTSAIRFPNSVDPRSLSNQQKQFVCTSALLENGFKQLDSNRDGRYGRAYVGSNLGSFRSYPASRQVEGDTCRDYEPRFRPWYVTATSGSKNVILLIDVSGSMDGAPLTVAKEAAKNVINTLSNSDFVGVVAFQTFANTIHSSRIQRATEQTKEQIIEHVEQLQAKSNTNYEQAFRKGLMMISQAQDDQFGSPCKNGENVLLFLTDGQPNEGVEEASGLIDIIKSYGLDISLFSYSFGQNTNVTILHELSCQFNGILFQITDISSQSKLTTIMREYYTFIAEGVSIDSPVWTEPYEDAFGFGRMVTVSMPIYYQNSDIRTILGVAGIDVVMGQLQGFGLDEQGVIKRLIKILPCHESSLDQCDIQKLRTTKCDFNCTLASGIPSEMCFQSNSQIFLNPVETSDYICCGLTIGAFVGIILGIVALLAIIIVIIVCLNKKQPPPPDNPDNVNNPNNVDSDRRQFKVEGHEPNYLVNEVPPPIHGYHQPHRNGQGVAEVNRQPVFPAYH